MVMEVSSSLNVTNNSMKRHSFVTNPLNPYMLELTYDIECLSSNCRVEYKWEYVMLTELP